MCVCVCMCVCRSVRVGQVLVWHFQSLFQPGPAYQNIVRLECTQTGGGKGEEMPDMVDTKTTPLNALFEALVAKI